jgi:transcriptional regulator with GAF, ATPase, and Fis domain
MAGALKFIMSKKPAKQSKASNKVSKATKATKAAKPPARAKAARPTRRAPKSTEFKLKAEPLPVWRDAKATLERWMLTEALTRTGGNMAAAGRILGITKVAILHAVRRHGLEALTSGA